jgi:hypothetical protein
MECESEVDALLTENRLIKDIQPRHNKDLKDDKSFPYLMITTHEDFPRVEITRTPKDRGAKLYGPFTSAGQLRGAIQVMQRVFKFRTCSLDIEESDSRWNWFRPCLLRIVAGEFPMRVGFYFASKLRRHRLLRHCQFLILEPIRKPAETAANAMRRMVFGMVLNLV